MARFMKAAVFVEPGRIALEERPIPEVGPLDALLRITTTTICGTDVHIMKGEYPVRKGLIIGHEPVGVIEKLGSAVRGYSEGQRVIAGAITPSMSASTPARRHDALPRRQEKNASPHERRRIQARRPQALVTHRFRLDDIEAAYDLFSHQRDGVLKVAITP
jgi:threonine dehydrogenase-like Zn-dependent dehydrogenase